MRKPRETGRSTRSSSTRPRNTGPLKKIGITKVKPKLKAKPATKKQVKNDDERPMEVTFIRVRNSKTPKSILQGGVTKQKNQQKKKTASVVGALNEGLLKKLAENVDSDKLSGVVNTLLEVAVVKKVLPRKKGKEDEPVQTPKEKQLKREVSIKLQGKPKKESSIETKSEIASSKEIEKKPSDKKLSTKEVKKIPLKEDKKQAVKIDKKNDRKINIPATDKKIVKKVQKKTPGKANNTNVPTKESKKQVKVLKTVTTESKKKPQVKAKNKGNDDDNLSSVLKSMKNEKSNNNSEVNKKESVESKKDSETVKKDKEGTKKESDNKRVCDGDKKDSATKKEESSKKSETITKNVDETSNEDVSKKSKTIKSDEIKEMKNPKAVKNEDKGKSEKGKIEKVKNVSSEEVTKPKKNFKKEMDSKKPSVPKTSLKKTNVKEKSKPTVKDESKTSTDRKTNNRSNSKNRQKVNTEDKTEKKIPAKRKSKSVNSDSEGSAKISQILNTPKRHREASLNALAKVHCLYENESRSVTMDIIDKSEKMFKAERKEKVASKIEKEEVEEPPVRSLRTAPGLRSVGRHWDILNATSSSSEDSSDSASDRKSVEKSPSTPPSTVEKKVKRRRKRSEVVMDLKDMVVKKRMASLNASAMMAATYSTDRRSNRSDDDSRRKDSDSRESSSTPEVVDVEETSDDEVILGGRKKALVIVNQDTADLTITGVYVNSTTRSTRHEGFCSISGMQYRISSTSHTQTETAVSTETTVIHTEHGESSRTGGSDGGSSCKTYTPLGALSNMQPPGSPRYPPSPSSSAFSAPAHHHSHPQEMHGYFQPAGPLISNSQLKTLPSQVEEMQGTSSSQAVTYSAYPPPPTGYLESPGYPHAYPKYHPPPPPGYPAHRRYIYPLEVPYQPPYPSPHYYNPYTPPPQPPPHYRPGPYIEHQYQPCPCPMQSCPKNVHTGPLTGTSKGSESNCTVPPVGASRGPVQLNPVALALPPEPNAAVNPPSPARGSAGLPPPASPALAQASWGTPPPPQSPSSLTSLEPQVRRQVCRTTSLSPPPHSTDILSEEPSVKSLRPIDRIVDSSDKYDRLSIPPVDRYQICDRLTQPSESIILINSRTIHPSEGAAKSNTRSSTESIPQTCNRVNHCKSINRLNSSEKVALTNDRTHNFSEKDVLSKNRLILSCEKDINKAISAEKSIPTTRENHVAGVLPHSNDRAALPSDNLLQNYRPIPKSEQTESGNRLMKPLPTERLLCASYLTVKPEEKVMQTPEKDKSSLDGSTSPELHCLSARTDQQRVPVSIERPKHIDKFVPQYKSPPSNERVSPISDVQGRLSEEDIKPLCKESFNDTSSEPRRKRSLSWENTIQIPKRRVSLNNTQPKTTPSSSEADIPLKRSKSPDRKAKKGCVSLKNGRRKKEVELKREVMEEMTLVPCVQLKWSNGWSWKGEPFNASVYIRDDKTESRKCYPAMKHKEGDIIQPRDCILLKSAGSRKNLPFVAKVAALWENPEDGEMMVSLLWYYRPEHTEQGRLPYQPLDEVFASKHKDSNSVACIEDKCYVLTFNEYCRYMKRCRQEDTQSRGWTPVPDSETGYPRANRMPPGRVSRDLIFFCRKVYDFRHSRILKNPC